MQDQLEQQLRRLILKFEADVRLAVLRSLQSVFGGAVHPGAGELSPTADALSLLAGDPLPALRTSQRRALTPEESVALRVRLTALIRQQPGQSTADLARIVGMPSVKLRRELRQLIDERVIEVEEKARGGFQRHTYRAAKPAPDPHAEPLTPGAGASA